MHYHTTPVPTQPGATSTANATRRYAIVGTGGRSWMFTHALASTYHETAELVAFCDVNTTRMAFYNKEIGEKFGHAPVATFGAADFDRMISETQPDVVIVCSIDCTHHTYIVRAMELGCDVITEKPMTTDVEKCREILDAVDRTGRNLTVTFNYRYSPIRTRIKELIAGGAIGDVLSVHFEWLLDTGHGADYFRRWHREKQNSGGLMVHKATHHFDLINWWLDSTPETVMAMGKLGFYGRENAVRRGVDSPHERGTGVPAGGAKDPFALDLRSSPNLTQLYLNAEHEDGYLRDRNVFSDGISIEDTMNLLVRYKSGAQMSYSLHAYAPWEGYRIAFNGTRGRIEADHQEASYINAGTGALKEGVSSSERILLMPHFGKPEVVEIPRGQGGHGGGDPLMLDDIFGKTKRDDPLGRYANHIDGARSILTGIAANISIETGVPVRVDELLRLDREPGKAQQPAVRDAQTAAAAPALL